MTESTSIDFLNNSKSKDQIIHELTDKLNKTELELNQLKKDLQQNLINKRVEINKLLQDRARFIDNLSHDLATPLTPLISLLPMIKEDLNSDNSKKLADTCLRNVKYIKRVIENARELADLTASDFYLKKENLFNIVDEIIKRYEIVFKSYNIKIENFIDKETEIKTQKDRLIQLLDQIISNSVNSMPKGGKLIFESKKVKEDKENFIQVKVSDTGIGLSRDQIDRVFNEFFKIDDSRHKLDSTGLGLSICKKIVEKHGGKIYADSRGENTGVSVIFTLPTSDSVFSRSF